MTDIYLCNMPCVALHRPSLSLGLLKAVLSQAGFSVKTYFGNLHFAKKIRSANV